MSDHKLDLVKEVAEPSRRALLTELKVGPRTVSDLVSSTGLKQPNVSNHLAKMRQRGIVRANKVGREVYYALASAEVEATLLGLVGDLPAVEQPPINLADAPKQYAKAAIGGEEQTCAKMIDNLVRQNIPLPTIYQGVLGEAMRLVGKWYEVEAIDVGQEHLASAITERMMARLIQYSPAPRKHAPTAVLACVEGNWHTIGLRMISDMLRLRGWRSVYLGASVPKASIFNAVENHTPRLVLINVTCDHVRETGLEVIRELVDLRPVSRFLLGAGGRAVNTNPGPFLEAGVDFTADTLMTFLDERLPELESKIPH